MLITLSSLSEKLDPTNPPPEFVLKDLIAQSEDTGHSQLAQEPMKKKNKVKKPRRENFEAASGDSDNNFGNTNGVNGHENDDMSRFD